MLRGHGIAVESRPFFRFRGGTSPFGQKHQVRPRDAPCTTTSPMEHRPFRLQRTRPFPPSGGRRRQHTAPADDGTARASVASIPPADARPVLSADGESADASPEGPERYRRSHSQNEKALSPRRSGVIPKA